jgi:cytoskeleton protein RodZ
VPSPLDIPPGNEPTLGAALRAAREAAGRTVEQVSADTRIRATLVRDLENDEFASSGGAVYARGHLKSIASALHLDPAPLLGMFDRVQGAPQALRVDTVEPIAAPVTFGGSAFAGAAASLRPERRTPRWGIAVTAAAAALAGIIGIGYAGSPGHKAPTSALGDSPTPAPVTTTAPAVVQTPDPGSVAQKPPVTGAQLRLRLIGGASWVSVSNAAGTLFEGVLSAGQFKDFSDPTRLKVIVGNAPVVNLNCGGKDSGQAGTNTKHVKHFVCTSTGLVSV